MLITKREGNYIETYDYKLKNKLKNKNQKS